jgi:hypothetical protein
MSPETLEDTDDAGEGDDQNDLVVPNGEAFSVAQQARTAGCHIADGDTTTANDTDTVSPAVIIAMDSEWVHSADRKLKLQNIVLAYGLYALCGHGGSARLIVEPTGPKRSQRYSLKRLIGLIIQRAIEQEVLDGWPAEIYLVFRYGRGDLAACSDFKLLRPQLDSVRGTLATRSRPIELNVEVDEKSGLPLDRLPLLPRALAIKALDRAGNDHLVRVRVLDTFCLAPEGASLDALGELLGYPKLKLPPGYDPSEMDRFRDDRPEEFRAYLLRDAEITARYAQRFLQFCARDLGLRRPPGTLGAAAVAVLLAELKEMGVDRQALYGLKTVKTLGYSRTLHRRRTTRQDTLTFAASLVDLVASDAYSGGRAETFMTGPICCGVLRDIDLRSAYPSAMAAMGRPFYLRCEIVRNDRAGEFRADALGVAEIEFDTPPGLRFPVFGVRTERGLIFPRRGRTVATAPEIAAARYLGVAVNIITGVIIPCDLSVRPYERFVVKMLKLRERLKHASGKDTLESKTVKVMTNSLYGKTAQGVRARTVYDARTRGSRPLSRSAVTSPVLAAYTTGEIRATIAELLNSIPEGRAVVSVSTDGFLTSATVEEIGLDGPATQVLLAARRRISGQTS